MGIETTAPITITATPPKSMNFPISSMMCWKSIGPLAELGSVVWPRHPSFEPRTAQPSTNSLWVTHSDTGQDVPVSVPECRIAERIPCAAQQGVAAPLVAAAGVAGITRGRDAEPQLRR